MGAPGSGLSVGQQESRRGLGLPPVAVHAGGGGRPGPGAGWTGQPSSPVEGALGLDGVFFPRDGDLRLLPRWAPRSPTSHPELAPPRLSGTVTRSLVPGGPCALCGATGAGWLSALCFAFAVLCRSLCVLMVFTTEIKTGQ